MVGEQRHVAERVDADHRRVQAARLASRQREVERDQLHRLERRPRLRERGARGQPGGDRCEHVAAVEGGGDRLEPPGRGGDLDRGSNPAEPLRGREQQPVVRPDEQPLVLGRLDRDRPPRAADLGVDDGEMDAARRVRQRTGQRQRALDHAVARDPVREVDDADLGRLPGDHGVDDADELVGRAVVRQERHRAHRAGDYARASATSAATRPSGVCGSASRSGSIPAARSAALVAGPIEAIRGPSGIPAAARKKRTVEAEVNVR